MYVDELANQPGVTTDTAAKRLRETGINLTPKRRGTRNANFAQLAQDELFPTN